MSANTSPAASPPPASPPPASPPSAGRVRLWYRIRPSKKWIEVGVFAAGEELWRAELEHVPRKADVRYQFDPPAEAPDLFAEVPNQ